LAFNQIDTLTISPTAGIFGGGAVLKSGTGTVVLSGTNNTYAGGTTINGGILTATNSGALPGFASAGRVSVASGATVAVSLSGWSQANIGLLEASASIPSGAYLGLDTSGGKRHLFQRDHHRWQRRRGRTGESRREHSLPHRLEHFTPAAH